MCLIWDRLTWWTVTWLACSSNIFWARNRLQWFMVVVGNNVRNTWKVLILFYHLSCRGITVAVEEGQDTF